MTIVNIDLPSGAIQNVHVQSNAKLSASKVVRHQSVDVELFGPTTTITALTKLLHIVKGANATLLQLSAAVVTVATGADRTVNVDLQRSTGGGAFATVLSATAAFTNGSTARVPTTGTISNAAGVTNDLYQLVVTVAGAAGAQALGLIVTLTFEEEYA